MGITKLKDGELYEKLKTERVRRLYYDYSTCFPQVRWSDNIFDTIHTLDFDKLIVRLKFPHGFTYTVLTNVLFFTGNNPRIVKSTIVVK